MEEYVISVAGVEVFAPRADLAIPKERKSPPARLETILLMA
jgi:hypothetical protein